MKEGYAKAEQRNQAAREALTPLAEGERPRVVTIGAVVAGLIALSIVGGYLAGVEVNGEKPRLAQVVAPALIMGVMAWGMWRARYWAVLGFQLILVFLIFSAVFGLAVQASSVAQFAATLGLLAVSGGFFFFMVKAMARIQMPERAPRDAMTPLGLPSLDKISALPADVLGALRMIPEIVENTRAMKEHTAQLTRVADALDRVAADTSSLPPLRADLWCSTSCRRPWVGSTRESRDWTAGSTS